MMSARLFCLLISIYKIEAQFVIERGERDVVRNLTGCSSETPDFCYFLHAEESPLDPCVCRCLPNYPMYRNPDVYLEVGKFKSKGRPACVWHSNHRYECFRIRKLGRGFHTRDDEGALEFDLRKPGSLMAFADHNISRCERLETAIKMPEETDFTPKTGLLTARHGRYNIIRFKWGTITKKYDGGVLRGVFHDCHDNVGEARRCFVGKISGIYNGGNCSVRALNGECCIFPFTYKDQVYHNCTTVDNTESWCAVRLPFFGNETNWWHNCTDSTRTTASSLVKSAGINVNSSSLRLSSSVKWPPSKAFKSDSNGNTLIIIIAMAIVAFILVAALCCLFLCIRRRKKRNKNSGLTHKKSANQATQSPASAMPDIENPRQSEIVATDAECAM